MKFKKFAALSMLTTLLHLSFCTFAFADGLSSTTGSGDQSTQQSSQQSSQQSTQQSSRQSSQQSSQQSLVVALVILGAALVGGGIALTVVLAQKTQREELVNEGYRGDGQLLRLLARQNGLSVEQTASIIRQANRKASKNKDRAARLQHGITTGIVAAKFHVSVEDVERINNKLSKSKKLSRCDRGRMLFTQLCNIAKKQRTFARSKREQQCSNISIKLKTLQWCKTPVSQTKAPL